MKRLVIVALTIVLMMCLQTVSVFASGIQIVDTHPRNHDTRVFPLNFAVRVYFDRDITGARYIEENQKFVVVRDEEGYEHPVTIIYNPDNPQMMLVWMTQELPVNTRFELTISGDFTTGASFLGDDFVLRFATRDMQRDMNTSMILMVVFFIVMMFISSRQMKRKAQKEAEEKEKSSKVNPYKVSKKTGKPVKEIVEKTEKERRKKEAEEAKLRAEQEAYEDFDEDDFEEYSDNYRVAGPRTISAFSTYKSGKKAKAEAEAKKKASQGTTRPKNQTGKAKNKKK